MNNCTPTRAKFWSFLLTLLLLSFHPFSAEAQRDGRYPSVPPKAKTASEWQQKAHPLATPHPLTADGEKSAYAVLAFDYTDVYFSDGLVKFPLQGSSTFEHIEMLGTGEYYISAAAYADGYYYYERNLMEGDLEVPVDLVRYDFQQNQSTVVGSLTGFDRHINDMTYDYSTKKMYAISRPGGGNSALFTIDLTTATTTKLFDLDRSFFTLACSYDGRLYGVSFEGDFCQIDPQTGTVTLIGATGLYPQYYQSMEFDHSTGQLYWAACLNENRGVENCMATIDLASGQATSLNLLGNQAQLVGLYIPFSAASFGAPAAPQDFKLTPDSKGAKEAALSWVAPSKTFDGQPISGTLSMTLKRNREPVKTFTNVSPGETITYTDLIADEKAGARYTYTLFASNEAGDGAEVEAEAFVGKDIPLPVTNLTLQMTSCDAMTLSWTMPTKGVNDGYVDFSTLTYEVMRLPDSTKVAPALAADIMEFSESGITPTQNYSYAVSAVNSEGRTEAVVTAPIVMGPILSMPYTCDFTDEATPDIWTINNANTNDGGWTWSENQEGRIMAHQPSLTSQSDDWLTSHYLPFEAGKTYCVDFDYHAFSADNIEFELQDKGQTVQTIFLANLSGNQKNQQMNFAFKARQSGQFTLALHALSPYRADWVELHQISIREAEKINLAAKKLTGEAQPMVGKPTDYVVTVGNIGASTVDNFDVMLKDQDGQLLAKTSATTPIKSGEESNVTISWTPANQSTTQLYAEISCPGDTTLTDNQTNEPLQLQVREAFDGELISIGTTSITQANSAPFDFFNQHSAALNLYSAEEIGRSGGFIRQIAFLYNTKSQYDAVENAPAKVYMANTERTDTKDGWIPQTEMTLVYDGTINIPKGETGELTLKLQKAFEYTGKNLAVLTTIDASSYYYYVYFTQYTSPLAGNASYIWGDYRASGFDFTQSGHVDWYGRTSAIMLYMTDEGDSSAISETSRPAASAPYTLYDLSGRLVANGTTTASGSFTAPASLRPGIYIVCYSINGKQYSRKIRM